MIELACCGCFCNECAEAEKGCKGCSSIEGKPEWIKRAGVDQCPFYKCCVVDKHLKHCGECDSLPCSLFYNCVDPSVSEEEAKQWIKERIEALRNGI